MFYHLYITWFSIKIIHFHVFLEISFLFHKILLKFTVLSFVYNMILYQNNLFSRFDVGNFPSFHKLTIISLDSWNITNIWFLFIPRFQSLTPSKSNSWTNFPTTRSYDVDIFGPEFITNPILIDEKVSWLWTSILPAIFKRYI